MEKTKILVTAKVRCSGKLHKISLAENGKLIFHDHDKDFFVRERTYKNLGGEPCRCYKILEAWKELLKGNKTPVIIPQELKKFLKEKKALGYKRRFNRSQNLDPLREYTLRERIKIRTRNLAKEELNKCKYRRSQSTWAGGEHEIYIYTCLSSSDVEIYGASDKVWSSNGKWAGNNSYIKAVIPLYWIPRVYNRGIAAVEGNFVLDVLEELPDGYIVLAGKQGRGFEVHLWKAKITDNKIKWLERKQE